MTEILFPYYYHMTTIWLVGIYFALLFNKKAYNGIHSKFMFRRFHEGFRKP